MNTKILFLFATLGFMLISGQTKNAYDIARSGTAAEMQMLMTTQPEAINSADSRGFTPLILACYRGNVEVAKFLIENVKDLNYSSDEGTALAALSINYNRELTEMLLRKTADPNIADGNGTTPLIWAVKQGNEELVALLLKYGAKKDKADKLGVTPFEYAMQIKKPNIINLLKTK